MFVVVLTAIAKVGWSIIEGGNSGIMIIKPAVLGVIAFVVGIWYFKRKIKR